MQGFSGLIVGPHNLEVIATSQLVYFISHNIARKEIIDNQPAWVHRKSSVARSARQAGCELFASNTALTLFPTLAHTERRLADRVHHLFPRQKLYLRRLCLLNINA